jgi:hypothetical protein
LIEHRQRFLELLLAFIRQFRIALVLGKEKSMKQHRQRWFLDLGHHPKASLDRLRLVLHCLRQQATAVLLGEIPTA